MKQHHYAARVEWTGNLGTGTSGYRAYSRDHLLSADGKSDIAGSSDPAFRGDSSRWNPEELLVGSVSTCHMLWYLHLAAEAGIAVTAYRDAPEGMMVEEEGGAGQFARIVLRPHVTIASGDPATAQALHREAHAHCFIARSVNFPIECEPAIVSA